MRKYRLLTIGLSGVKEEEKANRIIVANTLCLTFGGAMLIIGPILNFFIEWKPEIFFPFIFEFLANTSVLYFNYRKQYILASSIVYYVQCCAIGYFGLMLGPVLHLEFATFFLILINYQLFRARNLRIFGLIAAFADLGILEVSYYNTDDAIKMQALGQHEAYIIHLLVVLAVMVIIIVLSKTYVRSNDMRFDLKRANSLIKFFTAQLTHELRTLLDSIHQVNQLLKDEVDKDPQMTKIKNLVDIGFNTSASAKGIINNVLDFASIEAGQDFILSVQPVMIVDYLHKVVEAQNIVANSQNKKIILSINMPSSIVTDPLNVNQILNNLLSNAIKYGSPNEDINVKIAAAGEQWEIIVSNKGFGIPESEHVNIFKPFVTLKPGDHEGMGLGLYIVESKVLAMGGTISISSEKEGLTVFTIKLPLVMTDRILPQISELKSPGIKLMPNVRPIRVLMAEDHEQTAFVLQSFLKEVGCIIERVKNGRQLLDSAKFNLLNNKAIDIFILDSRMPVLDGPDTVAELKAIDKLSLIPILVIAGDSFTGNTERMIQGGADMYLTKPIDYDDLKKVIINLLEKNTTSTFKGIL